MANSIYRGIDSMEYEQEMSQDQVEDVHKSQGSLKIYITAAREWAIYEHSSSLTLGKMQSPATEICSTKLNFFKILDPSTRIIPTLKSVFEQIIDILGLDETMLETLESGISSIVENNIEDIKNQRPREFEIQVFIEITESEEVSSEEEFVEEYGELFKGGGEHTVLRTKTFEGWKGDIEEVLHCKFCSLEFWKGNEVVVMPCGHMFHKRCILSRLNQRNHECPECGWRCAKKNEGSASCSLEQLLRELKIVMSK